VWLYFRFHLSFRDVQDLLAERGVVVSRAEPTVELALISTLCATDAQREAFDVAATIGTATTNRTCPALCGTP